MLSRFSENATGRVASNPFGGSDINKVNYNKQIRHGGLDPSDEMRNTLSQLTARARQLVEHETNTSHTTRSDWRHCNTASSNVSGSGLSHIPPIAQNAHALRAMASKTSSTLTDLTTPSTMSCIPNVLPSSSVEVFMARQLGVDVAEQQHLLHTLEQHQPREATIINNATSPGVYKNANCTIATEEGVGQELNEYIAHITHKYEEEQRCALHERLHDAMAHRQQTILKASWEPYFLNAWQHDSNLLAQHEKNDMMAMMAKNNNNNNSLLLSSSSPHMAPYNVHGATTSNANPIDNMNESSLVTNVNELMMGHSSWSASVRHKAITFARYVNEYAPREWISYFTTYVRDTPLPEINMNTSTTNTDCNASNALTQLWCDVSDIFDELRRSEVKINDVRNTSIVDTEMRYLSASRSIIEQRAWRQIITHVQRERRLQHQHNPDKDQGWHMDELFSASQAVDLIADYCAIHNNNNNNGSNSNPWEIIFHAMRAGRYDAALLAAESIGSVALTRALERFTSFDITSVNNYGDGDGDGGLVSYDDSTIDHTGSINNNTKQLHSMKIALMPPYMELQILYNEAVTNNDPFRKAVLFVLLVGKITPESTSANAESHVNNSLSSSSITTTKTMNNKSIRETLLELCGKTCSSIEDVLWLRLANIREVSQTPEQTQEMSSCNNNNNNNNDSSNNTSTDSVQSLRTLQRTIYNDITNLVQLTNGDVIRLARFLIHALLPCSALRLLLERALTFVDGFHLAMCFDVERLLHISPIERDIHVAQLLQEYTTMILLPLHRNRFGHHTSPNISVFTILHYFIRATDPQAINALVELCQSERFFAQLFGQCTLETLSAPSIHSVLHWEPHPSQESQLLHDPLAGEVNAKNNVSESSLRILVDTLTRVAHAIALRGNVVRACFVYLFIVQTLMQNAINHELSQSSLEYCVGAINSVVELLLPAIAQVFYLAHMSAYTSELFDMLACVQKIINDLSTCVKSSGKNVFECIDIATTATFARMTEFYTFATRQQGESALHSFFALSFIPHSMVDDLNECVYKYINVHSVIKLATNALLPLAFNAADSVLEQIKQNAHVNDNLISSDTRLRESEAAMSILQMMKVVCEWVRQIRTRGEVDDVLPECERVANQFERKYFLEGANYQ